MRNFKHFIAIAVVFLAGATAASAQLVDGNRISVSVPNEFVLRDTTLPAGEYTIERTPVTTDSPSLLIIRGEGETMIFDTIRGESAEAADATRLLFDNVDGTSYLAGIVVKGTSIRNDIPRTKRYKQAVSDGSAQRTYVTVTNTGF